MISVKEIAWLAGLLEGEGCFHLESHVKVSKQKYKSGVRISVTPLIRLSSTDKDVIVRAKYILGANTISTQIKKPNKDYHTISIFGPKAISWMMTIYPLMCSRRKFKIKSIISSWKIDFSDLKLRQGELT